MNLENLRKKKIAILGIGKEGISLARFFYKHKISEITLCDQKSQKELDKEIQQIPGKPRLILGKNYLKNLIAFDICFRSPGVTLNLLEIQKIKSQIQFSSATNLFFSLCPGKIIGVTGTKGKGTTASFIYEVFRAAGKRVFLAGNIGTPALDILDKIKKNDWVIYELSSFQLEDLKFSPHVGIFLNIFLDHLDHHQDFSEYLEAKTKIFRYQQVQDFAIINYEFEKFFKKIKFSAKKIFFGQESNLDAQIFKKQIKFKNQNSFSLNKSKLVGIHNAYNLAAGILAAKTVGIQDLIIQKTINKFKGLPHRLEFVRTFQGVDFFNDSLATVPESTIAALRAFSMPKILIVGGSDKGADFSKLGKSINTSNVKKVILLGQTKNKIKKTLKNFPKNSIIEVGNLSEAVSKAWQSSKKGDTVLLSPACASFDMFSSYKERGENFKTLVKKLNND